MQGFWDQKPGHESSRQQQGAGAAWCASPNFGARRGRLWPRLIVIHYTGMQSAEAALARLCDPAAEVSAHYLIAEDGRTWQLVDEAERAWHAGASAWGGAGDVNSRSIGIELANPGTGPAAHPFPEPQMAVLEQMLDAIMARWRIGPAGVLGHSCVAPGRKIDPGPGFDWRRLALGGRAVWLDRDGSAAPVDPALFQAAARRFGYGLEASGAWDAPTLAVWRGFRDRFARWASADRPCGEGVAHLERLAARWPAEAAPRDHRGA